MYNSNLLVKYFKAVKEYTELTKIKRENHLKAEQVSRFKRLNRIYSQWVEQYNITIECQMNNRIVSNHSF